MSKDVSRPESSLAPLGWPFRSLQREVNRVFRDFFDEASLPETGFASAFTGGIAPKMDIAETEKAFEVIVPNMERRFRETDSAWVREELGRYQNPRPCEACGGQRLKPEALSVRVGGLNIAQSAEKSIEEAAAWFASLGETLTAKEREIVEVMVSMPLASTTMSVVSPWRW